MAWIGYWQYAGNEVINVARTEAYAKNMGMGWFRPSYKPDTLHWALGRKTRYSTPYQDEDVPWVDPDDPATLDFIGVYPLDITGADDSTRVGNVIEYALDGGTGGRLRNGTRAIVFSALLIGRTEEANEAGMRWLRNALLGGPCETVSIPGDDLCFFGSEPCVGTSLGGSEDCADDYFRKYANVIINTGPTVSAKQQLLDGGSVWTVSWTAVAGNPFQYGANIGVTDYQWFSADDPFYGPNNKKGGTNDGGYLANEVACRTVPYQPINDPSCPILVVPPGPPAVALNCFSVPAKWTRYRFTIPSSAVPLWSDVVPVMTLTTPRAALDTVRFRFYVDRQDGTNPSANNCDYCSEFIVTYMPQNTALDIDAVNQQVVFRNSGQAVRAEHLLTNSKGGPFSFPVLSCGTQYLVLVDSLATQKMPYVDFNVVPRSA